MSTLELTRQMVIGVAACAAALLLGACNAPYGADVRNKTSQPLYAQIFTRIPEAQGGQALRATARLGPGDRALLGPIMAPRGSAFLALDSLPNAEAPFTFDLAEGTSYVDVTTDEQQHLHIEFLSRPH